MISVLLVVLSQAAQPVLITNPTNPTKRVTTTTSGGKELLDVNCPGCTGGGGSAGDGGYTIVIQGPGADGGVNWGVTVAQIPVLFIQDAGVLNVQGPLTDTQLRATAVPISAASLPLPSGAATASNQTTLGSSTTKINDGVDTALVSGSGSLQVTCDNCGGSTFADNGAFSFGTSGISNIGFVFDDTSPNAVTEDHAGTPRMAANRVPYSTLRDAAGNERGANVNASNALLVAQTGALPAGSNVIGHTIADTGSTTAVTGNVTVVQPTASSLNAQVQGAGASGAAKAGNPVQIGAVFNTAEPTITTGQGVEAQADQAGNLRTFAGTALTTLTGWTSATALNTTQTIFSNSGATGVLLHLVQTTTVTGGAITFEVSYDNANWVTIPADAVLDPASTSFAQISLPYALVASTNKPFLLVGKGWQGLRIKLSTAITGTATVTPNYALLNDTPVRSVLALSPTAANFNVTTTPPANASTNVVQFGGTNVSTGVGASGAGIPRVTISNDSSLAANQSVNVAQINGVTPLMGVGASGTGAQRVAALLHDGTTTVGVIAGTTALKTDLSSVAGTATATGNGTAAGSIRVSVASDSTGTIAATESGTWTVQPGNTANTTPWLATARVVGNSGAIVDAANNTAAPANVIAAGFETAAQGTTQPTAATTGNMRRAVVATDGVLYVREGGPVQWSAFVQAVTVLTSVRAAPAAGIRAYVTSVSCSNQAATAQTIDVVFGTGANCATTATALTHKWQMGTNATTTSPYDFTVVFPQPLVPTAANLICVRPSAASAFGCTVTGYDAP